MIFCFSKNLDVLARLNDERIVYVKELKTDDEQILKVLTINDETLDISEVDHFIVDNIPKTPQKTFHEFNLIFPPGCKFVSLSIEEESPT